MKNTNKKRFLPVIHVEKLYETEENAKIAFDNGADGIFLIIYNIQTYKLLEIYDRVRILYPDRYIGLNLLDLGAGSALRQIPRTANALWVDSPALVGSPSNWPFCKKAREFWERRQQYPDWEGECFVGVAFKHQPTIPMAELAAVTKASAPFMDVVVTSGKATGVPPIPRKLEIMREAIGNEKRLAQASGITPKNVFDSLPFIDDFIANTGVSRSPTELEPRLVRVTGDIIHNYSCRN